MKHIIPIKHGGKHYNEEAYANLRTGQVQDIDWNGSPDCLMDGEFVQKYSSSLYAESWERIFGRKNG